MSSTPVQTAAVNRYQLIIEAYTIPQIGDNKLKKLTIRHLQKLYKELLESGRIHRGKGQRKGPAPHFTWNWSAVCGRESW